MSADAVRSPARGVLSHPRPATRRIAAGLAGPPILRALLLAVWITAFSLRPFIIPGPTMFGPPRPGLAWSAPFPWTNPAIPGLAVGAAWLLVALALLPRLGKGRLVVAWPGRPPATGGTADFHVGTSDGGARLDGVRVLLRCVRESRCGVVRRPEILWVRDAGLDRDAAITPGDDLRVRFDVPARLPATDLQARDAIYWELVVLGRVGPHDYADCVLVPVGAPRTP